MANGILKRRDLGEFRRTHRDETIVFTNGCFDLLHRGHIELLLSAKRLGDRLVVGINSDRSMKRLKGAPRPLVGEDDRAFVLLQLRPVDYVTIFEEDTPLETIRSLAPDVLVKGAEYRRGEIVGADLVEGSGGKVVRVKMVEGYSTSELIDKIRA
jgi:rfaE bifunctional protein nucleotidyltransferase chain/domain